MKGVVLAGGKGSRLSPLTRSLSKQLLPIYDKPMVFYPISVLMLADIKDILIISDESSLSLYNNLLGSGEELGLNFSYAVQKEPKGIAESFIIGEDFIDNDNVSLVLGDNIFYGQGLSPLLQRASNHRTGATIFARKVIDPTNYGIVDFDNSFRAISIEEKPKHPKSNFAVTGLYFYDNGVIDIAKSIEPSNRGELEISSVNQIYLDNKNLNVELLGRGFTWLDTGTPENLLAASNFVQTIESQQGYKIACLEEIAYLKGWIDGEVVLRRSDGVSYGNYLKALIKDG